ncbi:MAG: RNA pseudouridine synthase [Cytophagaceae bacterium]|nr:RNA pseudouridine synthase [Cytophagaceae bacterium]
MESHRKYFEVVYEDNHLIIVNKKSGVLVQGDETGDIPLSEHVKTYLKEKYNKPGNVFAGVVHRLDRPVTGLVVLAKTSKALERMNKLFQEKNIVKIYWAIVKNKPKQEEATLIHWLVKDQKRNVTAAFLKENKEGQRSELSYKLLAEVKGYYLLEVRPKTGRPHQIRTQLSSIGCPIVGDIKYGYKEANEDKSINLHARKLEFIHPVKKELLNVIAGLPQNKLWKEFNNLID